MSTPKQLTLALLLALGLAVCGPSRAQESESPGAADAEPSFGQASSSARQDLDRAVKELAALRESIAAEKVPLNRELSRLENRLRDARTEFDDASRGLDRQNLDLNNLRTEVESRKKEATYLSDLLDEYLRNLESRVHITELQRYRDLFEEAHLAPEDGNLTPAEVYDRQIAMIEVSVTRLQDLLGGTTFEGTAVGDDGVVKQVNFALFGPVAVYAAEDGSSAGLADQRLGSLEPNMVPLEDPAMTADARQLAETGQGRLPLDPTLGNAERIAETHEGIVEHAEKGGFVMVPILLLAAAALLVAIYKWAHLVRVRKPSDRKIERFLQCVQRRDFAEAGRRIKELPGPVGEMLRAGLENLGEPKELIEEVMYEKTLETRLSLQRFLSFVAIAAAAAPLLGLLGTVTGIINTFKLITVFGTGDAKTLSSGISEALITTEFGLIVAIPSLFLHAYLSRKAKRFIDAMEKTAVKFLNRVRPGSMSRVVESEAESDDERVATPAAGILAAGVAPSAGGVDH